MQLGMSERVMGYDCRYRGWRGSCVSESIEGSGEVKA